MSNTISVGKMALPEYEDIPVHIPTTIDTSGLVGKSVLVTGGESPHDHKLCGN